jgi:hypothetical protein
MLNAACKRSGNGSVQRLQISLVHGNEAEWLQADRGIDAGAKQFRQPENWSTLRRKHQFHNRTGCEWFEHAQQAAGYRNRLKFGGGTLSVLQAEARGRHPGKPYTGSTDLALILGGESHGAKYATK